MKTVAYGFAALAVSASVIAAPVRADEFTDVVNGALAAYEDGDITAAREELDYAVSLLADLKSESLREYLPEALPGWTRSEGSSDNAGMGMAMFGGGNVVSAEYANPEGDLSITLVANSPMVGTLGAVITGLAGMGGGKPVRIQRVSFADNDGELQGIVDQKVLVSVTGDASLESKKAYLEAMDLQGLKDF